MGIYACSTYVNVQYVRYSYIDIDLYMYGHAAASTMASELFNWINNAIHQYTSVASTTTYSLKSQLREHNCSFNSAKTNWQEKCQFQMKLKFQNKTINSLISFLSQVFNFNTKVLQQV